MVLFGDMVLPRHLCVIIRTFVITSVIISSSLFISFVFPSIAHADITAASCSKADVTAAMDAATTTENIYIPSGTCTWASQLLITKPVAFVGGFGGTTTIQDYGFQVGATNNWRITNIQFVNSSFENDPGDSFHGLVIDVDCNNSGLSTGWSIDNDTFTGYGDAVITTCHNPHGVIADNVFTSGTTNYDSVIYADGGGDSDSGNASWAAPSAFGTINMGLFVEDNLFVCPAGSGLCGHILMTQNGGSAVFRCNTASSTDSTGYFADVLDNHGFGEGSGIRGTREMEAYGNLLKPKYYESFGFNLRGGSQRIFDNVFAVNGTDNEEESYSYAAIYLHDYRADAYNEGLDNPGISNTTGFYQCNLGGAAQPSNIEDMGIIDSEGYPGCDQIGRGQDLSVVTATDRQSFEGSFFWNNTIADPSKTPVLPVVAGNNNPTIIQLDRDYFQGVIPSGYAPFTYPYPTRGIAPQNACLSSSASEPALPGGVAPLLTGASQAMTGIDFSIPSSPPFLTASIPTSVSTSTMTLNANLISLGSSPVTESGFVYGTDSSLSTVIATTTNGSQPSTGVFSQGLTGLIPNTTYYFQAYAVNSIGTSTSSILSTTTLPFTASSPAPAGTNTYYIDYANGSDSNNGTSKSTPWKLAPGMTGFAGSYTHSAGDHFIFKGGVTWPNSVLTFAISNSGTSGNPDYYGVDKTWYAGSSWNRPMIDAQGQISGTGDIDVSITGSYVTFDDFELKGHFWNSSFLSWVQDWTILDSGNNNLIENNYIHGWSHASYASGNFDYYNIIGADETGETYNNFIDGSDTAMDSGDAFRGGNIAIGNTVRDMPNAFVGPFNDIHGNTIYDLTDSFDPTQHGNVIETWCVGTGCTQYIYDNIIHDTTSLQYSAIVVVPGFGVTSGSATAYVYNNVMWNISWGGPIAIDSNNATISNDYIFNNTDSAGNAPCIWGANREDGSLNTLDLENNFCISDGGDDEGSFENLNGIGVTNSIDNNNIVITTATATSQGYTTENAFAPTATIDSSVNAGVNLTATSTILEIPDLTSDINGTPRPSSGPWDIGAYEYAVPYTVLITAPSGGTITSSDGSINCGKGGNACLFSTTTSISLILTATPSSGYTFSSWGGACSGTSSTCNLSTTTSVTVSASFTATKPLSGGSCCSGGGGGGGTSYLTLTIKTTGTGSGTITSSPSRIFCGLDCSALFPPGSTVILTATPASSSSLVSWTGCTSVATSTCSVTLASATTIGIDFALGTTTTPIVNIIPAVTSSVPNCPAGFTCTPLTALSVGTLSGTVGCPPTASFTTPLTLGMVSPEVKNLQIFLNSHGFTVAQSGNGSPGHETTYYGQATAYAVSRFQEAYASKILTPYGLTQGTGNFGQATMKEANLLNTSNCTASPTTLLASVTPLSTVTPVTSIPLASTPSTPTTVSFTQNLSLGSTGTEVKNLQIFLNSHGFTVAQSGNGSPGHESTYFGLATKAALARYQKAKGITPSAGYFGAITRKYVNDN